MTKGNETGCIAQLYVERYGLLLFAPFMRVCPI